MAAAPAARPPRPARRVVLTGVARRDAAQRLSLALCLLARAGRTPQDRAARAGGPGRPEAARASEDLP